MKKKEDKDELFFIAGESDDSQLAEWTTRSVAPLHCYSEILTVSKTEFNSPAV